MLSEIEKELLSEQRLNHRKIVSTYCAIGILVLFSYILMAPTSFGYDKSYLMTYRAPFMMLAVSLVFIFSRSKYYLSSIWLEVPLFWFVYATQLYINWVFFIISDKIGSSPTTIIAYNTAVLLCILSIISIGSIKSFVVSSSGIVISCILIVRNLGLSQEYQVISISLMITAFIAAICANIQINISQKKSFEYKKEILYQSSKIEELLYNVLPESVATRLSRGEFVADSFSEISVIFVDIVNFTELSRKISPKHLVETLNIFFSTADACAVEAKVEKVKTIGDAYLAVAGAQIHVPNSAVAALDFGLALLRRISEISSATNIDISIRIGIHTGSVVGGVIGDAKKAYDYWGETMNIASRIQSACGENAILVSEATSLRAAGQYRFYGPRIVSLKGIGEARVFELLG